MKQVKNTKGVDSKMQEQDDQSVAEAHAELIYWTTERTKIYPEKDFAKKLYRYKS